MRDQLQSLLYNLKELSAVPEKHLNKALSVLEQETVYTKEEGANDHFCSFFVPIDVQTKRLFLVHHKKADDWIPPGGHIDANESPHQAVIREFKEELDVDIAANQLELFTFTTKPIGKGPCRTHLDFWFLVHTNEEDYSLHPHEFIDAKWLDFKEAHSNTKHKEDKRVIQQIVAAFS